MSAPVPIVVGAPRSGTTLLRLMLDAHPRLAIPPETGFLPQAARLPAGAGPEALVALVTGFESWPDFHLAEEDFAAALAELGPFDVAAGVRAFYRLYARRFGKPRYGDKTPGYALHLPALARLLPEARFVHLVRDGRDVAVSVRPLWFAPSRAVSALARDWAERVEAARAFGRGSPSYLELRYEDLVRAPEAELRRVCAFLHLDFDPAMLRHHERAARRLDEHEARRRADGSVWLSKRRRRLQQRRAERPPDAGRIGRWRRELSPEEAREFERVAGGVLRACGYACGGAGAA